MYFLGNGQTRKRSVWKKLLPFLASGAALITLVLFNALSVSSAPVDSIQIGSAEEMLLFANSVNNGNTYTGKTILLTNDIDISSIANWPAVGHTITKYFGGVFDGQEHTISGLTITGRETHKTEVGLFGTIKGATIKNLRVETSDAGVNAVYSVGAVAGYIADNAKGQTTLIENVHAKGNVTGSSYSIGVLIGKIEVNSQNAVVIIKNCSSEGTATSKYSGYVGGLIGHAYFKATKGGQFYISDCESDVTVSSKTNYAGGFVGILENNYKTAEAVVENCTTWGSVTNDGAYTGGFTSEIRNFTVRNCYVLSDAVRGKSSYVGGFVGFVDNVAGLRASEIHECGVGAQRPVNVSGGASYVGGFVGHALTTLITSCYTYADVSGGSTFCGGFAGVITKSCVDSSYAVADVTSPNYCVGGFAGYLESKNIISNCYALGDVSSTGGGNENNAGGFAGSASEAQIINCFCSGQVYGARKLSPYQGAFIGHVYPKTTLDNCYYDSEITSGMSPYGIGAQYITGSLYGVQTDHIYAALGLEQ
ncbi:MAG: hypothetical protein LBB94_08580 [Clostridiales bacterium]|jgi:hypothetical protein|nr:hypothetical protein [Clostridiales bacterium]